eukprot:SAG31_NODE_264_length_18835_cov_7.543553_16_plen_147_part_00
MAPNSERFGFNFFLHRVCLIVYLAGVNRRQQLPDGRTIIGINPAGVIDRAVDVIRLDDLEGKTLCTIISTACHPIVLGPSTTQLSSDYVGPARDIVEAHTGAICLFLQGAGGNIMPATGVGGGGPEQFDDLQVSKHLLIVNNLRTD